jgi:hypothetical protein
MNAAELRTELNRFRGFRHVARTSYGTELDWAKVAAGIDRVAPTLCTVPGSHRALPGLRRVDWLVAGSSALAPGTARAVRSLWKGTPEQVAQVQRSHRGRFLAGVVGNREAMGV